MKTDHPLSTMAAHPALQEVIEKGRHFTPAADCAFPTGTNGAPCQLPIGHAGPCQPYKNPGQSAPSLNSQPSTLNFPQVDAAALEQLETLETFDHAVEQARASGGPSAALQSLIQRPIKVGPYRLASIASYHFMFLQLIQSPFVTGGQIKKEEMPLHLAKALLAFASVPVEDNPTAEVLAGREADPPCYLSFDATGPGVDLTLLNQDAWVLSLKLSPTDLARATNWIIAQIGGIASLFPAAGEEAGNFPIAGTPAASPPTATPPAPQPPVGSSSC